MATVQFRLDMDRAGLARVTRASMDEVVASVAGTLQSRIKANIITSGRVRTGDMYRSVNVSKPRDGARYVTVDTPYAMFQEQGIGPVFPVRAKVLRFTPKGSGVAIFRPSTSGFPGAHFMRRAFESLGQGDVHL